jgi:hypothetical protein
MNRIPKPLRNVGESAGLEYPYIYRRLWVVWHRHTGEIAHIEHTGHEPRDRAAASRKARELNGLPDDEHDPAINALHDLEP